MKMKIAHISRYNGIILYSLLSHTHQRNVFGGGGGGRMEIYTDDGATNKDKVARASEREYDMSQRE